MPTFPSRMAARIREDVCKVPGAGAGTVGARKQWLCVSETRAPVCRHHSAQSPHLFGGGVVSRATGSRQSIGGGERKMCLQKTKTSVS